MNPLEPREDDHDRLARETAALDRLLLIFVLSAAAATIILALLFIATVGKGREHLGARLAVAVASILLLGLVDGHATRLMSRRRPLLTPDTPGFRRFVTWSAIAFFSAAAFLLAVAWYW